MVAASLVALCFAAHNALTASKTQMYDTLSALLVACVALQLPPSWGYALVAAPLLSVILGQSIQYALTPWPC
jgi:hypothetical protein